MFLAHSFRLRHPWDSQPQGERTHWSRVFHKPTGLETSDRLWLVVSHLPEDAAVTMNDQPLVATPRNGTATHGQYDVTELLADANTVSIDAPTAASPKEEFPFDVRLGILGYE